MLRRAGELEGLEMDAAGLASSEATLLDIFIRHFAQLLERQLHQGMLRDYRETADNLDQVRGRIDLVRQQRENPFQPQRLACRFDELTPDILVNRLLHSAVVAAHALATSPRLKQRLGALRQRFVEIGRLDPRQTRPRSSDLGRLQRRYASVVDWANAFLDRLYPDVRSGPNRVCSLLFDMNRLFERYAARLIRPSAQALGLRLIEQGPKRYLARDESERGHLLMQPDITLTDGQDAPRAIFDAKWKLLSGNSSKTGISPADLYQMSSYASAFRCPLVTLLYPEQSGLPVDRPQRFRLDTGPSSLLHIQALPLEDRIESDYLARMLE